MDYFRVIFDFFAYFRLIPEIYRLGVKIVNVMKVNTGSTNQRRLEFDTHQTGQEPFFYFRKFSVHMGRVGAGVEGPKIHILKSIFSK